MKLTAKAILAIGPGAAAAWFAARPYRGEIPWEMGSPEAEAIKAVEQRCMVLYKAIEAKAEAKGVSFEEFATWEYDVRLSAFEARWVSWELVAYVRILEKKPWTLSTLHSLLRPEILPAEYMEDLRERLLAEADRLDAEAASESDS